MAPSTPPTPRIQRTYHFLLDKLPESFIICALLGEAFQSPQDMSMYGFCIPDAAPGVVPAAVPHLPVEPSRIIARQPKPFVFCIFRTLFKSPYPSHSTGLTAPSAQNVISSLFRRLRTLSKTGSATSPFESALYALFRKTPGGGGYLAQTQSGFRPAQTVDLQVRFSLLLRLSTLDVRLDFCRPYSRRSTGNSNRLIHFHTLSRRNGARFRRRPLPPSPLFFARISFHGT